MIRRTTWRDWIPDIFGLRAQAECDTLRARLADPDADRRALESDWDAIGHDLRAAMDAVIQRTEHERGSGNRQAR